VPTARNGAQIANERVQRIPDNTEQDKETKKQKYGAILIDWYIYKHRPDPQDTCNIRDKQHVCANFTFLLQQHHPYERGKQTHQYPKHRFHGRIVAQVPDVGKSYHKSKPDLCKNRPLYHFSAMLDIKWQHGCVRLRLWDARQDLQLRRYIHEGCVWVQGV